LTSERYIVSITIQHIETGLSVKFRYLTIVLAAMLLPGDASARTEPFGQETVELRAPRFQRAKQPAHRHGPGHAHQHAHPQGHNHAHGDRHGRNPQDPHFGHQHGLETENLFGFTLGSDTEHAGAKAVAIEIVGRFGKRTGSYNAYGKKLEFAYGITDNVSAGVGLFAIHQRVSGVAGFDNVDVFSFNGIGGELRWRLLQRGPNPFGMTLHFEPSVQSHDELTGLRGIKYGSENKLIFDTELMKDKWFAAFNVIYEVEYVKERGETEWERASKFGFGLALTHQIAKNVFLGVETRYLRAYDGLVLGAFTGEAIYLGPTLFTKLGGNAWLSLAWGHQVWGEERGNPQRLDLVNFERNQVRLKAGIEF
jgi:hypothetical protein